MRLGGVTVVRVGLQSHLSEDGFSASISICNKCSLTSALTGSPFLQQTCGYLFPSTLLLLAWVEAAWVLHVVTILTLRPRHK